MKRNIGAELTARMTHVNEMLANGESVEAISRADVDRPQPAAWLAFATDGSDSSAVYMMQEQAQAAADEWGWSIAPLYSTPGPHATPGECTSQGGCTLTDAEREAIEAGIKALRPRPTWNPDFVEAVCEGADKHAAVLRSMLEAKK